MLKYTHFLYPLEMIFVYFDSENILVRQFKSYNAFL